MKMKLHAELIFHVKGFALKLVLKQRHKRTREWPIVRKADNATHGINHFPACIARFVLSTLMTHLLESDLSGV